MLNFLLESILLLSKPKTYFNINLIINIKSITDKFMGKWITNEIDYTKETNYFRFVYYQTKLNGYLYDKELIIRYDKYNLMILNILIIEHTKNIKNISLDKEVKFKHLYLTYDYICYYCSIIQKSIIYNYLKKCIDDNYLKVIFEGKIISRKNYNISQTMYKLNDTIQKQRELNYPVLIDVKNKNFLENITNTII